METEFKSMLDFSENEKVDFNLLKIGTLIQNYGFYLKLPTIILF